MFLHFANHFTDFKGALKNILIKTIIILEYIASICFFVVIFFLF